MVTHAAPRAALPPVPGTAVIAALAIGGAAFAYRFLSHVGYANDHFVTLTRGVQILLGEWPTRDFVDPGSPLTYLVSAAGQALGGRSLVPESIIVYGAFALAAALTVVGVSWWTGHLWLGAWAAVVEVLILPRSYSYPKVLLYAAAIVAFVSYARRQNRPRLAATVAVTVLAFLFRHDHGVYLALGTIVLLVGIHRPEGWGSVARRLGVWMLATIMALTPYLLYVERYLGVRKHLLAGARFSRAESVQTRLGWVYPRFSASPEALAEWLYYAFWAVPVLAAVVYLCTRRGRTPAHAVAPAVIVLCVCANVGFLRDPLVARVPDAIVPIVALVAWLTASTLRTSHGAGRMAAGALQVACLVTLVGAAGIVGHAREQWDRTGMRGGLAGGVAHFRSVVSALRAPYDEREIPSDFAVALVPFYEYVQACTSEDAKVFVPGFIPEVPYYARRGFAGGHVMLWGPYHGSVVEQRETIARLRRQNVPFVVTRPGGLADLKARFPLIAGYVIRHYGELIVVPSDDDQPGHVLVRLDAIPVREYERYGWPCFR